MNIEEAMKDYIHPLLYDSPRTAKAYRLAIRKFIEFLETRGKGAKDDVTTLIPDDFIQYVPWLQRNFVPSTATVYLFGTQGFLDWLVISCHVKMDYEDGRRLDKAKKILLKKRDRSSSPEVPPDEDVDKIIAVIKNRKPIQAEKETASKRKNDLIALEPIRIKRDIALLLFLLFTGCRNQEICDLRIDDINLKKHSALVMGKGKKPRTVFFTQEVADALHEYWQVRGWSARPDPVFARHDPGAGKKHKPLGTAGVRHVVDSAEQEAGLEGIHPHIFRHVFATNMLARTHDLALTSITLGHASPETTLRFYAAVTDAQKETAYRDAFGE